MHSIYLKSFKIILLAALLTTAACSNNKNKENTESQLSPSGTSGAMLVCNSGTTSGLDARIKVLRDSETLKVDYNFIQLRLSQIPTSFVSGSSSKIRFYKWKASSLNNAILDPTPLSFQFYRQTIGDYSTAATEISFSQLETLRTAAGYNTIQEYLQNVTVLISLNDPTATYEALQINSYVGSNAEASLNLLLPPFAITPTEYAVDFNGGVRPSILQTLHPFKSLGSSSLQELTSLAPTLCF